MLPALLRAAGLHQTRRRHHLPSGPVRILVAFEKHGRVRDAFRARGHDATSCDIEPSTAGGPHIQADALPLMRQRWDMVIAHPPCTFLTNSGVRWLHERPERWEMLEDAAAVFRACLDANAPAVAVENPIMHKHAVALVGRRHDCTVQPYEHGDPYTKRTAFWLKGLPPLMPTQIVANARTAIAAVANMGPSPDRAEKRSITYPGIARAMAQQWG